MAKGKGKEKFDASKDKDERLQLALAAIEKGFGKGSIITKSSEYPQIERIPTGSPALDKVTNGGYGKGRIVEIYGPESSGKTTLTLCAIAECQKQGGKCAFIDAEHALDPHYAALLGVDIDEVLISQPDCGEDAMNIADTLVRSGAVDLIVVDSVAALTPRAELEGQAGDHRVGSHARLMSQTMRMLTSAALKSNTTIIFINQIRMKIGVMFGSPETTTGGEALKFFASQRFEIRRAGIIKSDDVPTGITSRIKVAKNKIGPPYRQVEVDIVFGRGIDWAKDLLNMAVEYDIVEKSGAWFSYKGEKIGQGAANAASYVRENPEVAAEIREQVML